MQYTDHYALKKPDLTDLVDVTDLNDNSDTIDSALDGKEDSSNKVTTISDQSTDTQYPSAKCVYDLLSQTEAKYTEIWDHDNVCKFTKAQLETMFSQKKPMCYQSHIVFLARSEEDGTKINLYYFTSVTDAPKWNPIVYRISVDSQKNIVTDIPVNNFFSGNYNDLSNKLTAGTNITISANNEISATGSLPSGTNAGDILVWDGYDWVSQKSNRLPSAYQEVEWIGSTGTQWIDTGKKATENTSVIAEASFKYNASNLSGRHLFGCRTTTNSGLFGITYKNVQYHSGLDFRRRNHIEEYQIIISEPMIEGTNNTFIPKTKMYLGGTSKTYRCGAEFYENLHGNYTTAETFTTAYNIYLFALNNAGSVSIQGDSELKCYRFTLTEEADVSLDLIPCYRKSDNVIGMYDLVTDTFFTNAGTGTFIKGADV